MDKAFKYGQMEAYMKAIGKMECLMVEVGSFMPMETSMKANGKTIWHTVSESINTQMVRCMKENG
jgi:hypothetical protein